MKKIISLFSLCALLAMPACAQTTNAPRLPSWSRPDPDATNFIARAGITSFSDKSRVTQLVLDLKAANLWTNLDALYPFVGKSSNSCAQNLVSTNWPITWSGGISFNSKGVVGNGIDAWGDTGYRQSTRGALTNDFHLYAWTEIAAQTNAAGPVFANAQPGAYGGLSLFQSGAQSYLAGYPIGGTSGALLLGTNGNAISIRSGANQIEMGEGALFTSSIGLWLPPTNSVRILGNVGSSGIAAKLVGYSLATVRVASFGRSLTAEQSTNYFAIMKRYALSAEPRIRSDSVSHPSTNAPRLPTP
jgi:hypothetical protein